MRIAYLVWRFRLQLMYRIAAIYELSIQVNDEIEEQRDIEEYQMFFKTMLDIDCTSQRQTQHFIN